MGLTHSPIGPSDGLVLCLDTANRRSYPGSGTNWFDLSGNGNHGVLTNGPTLNTGPGGGINFDGVNDYVDCGKDAGFKAGAIELSVFCWVYANINDFSSSPKVICENSAFNVSSGGFWFALDNRGSGRATSGIGCQIKTTSGAGGRDASVDNVFSSTSIWRHIGFVYKANSLRIYINALDITTREAAIVNGIGNYQTKDANFTIAASNDINNFAKILINDIRMYSRALTPAEIRQLFEIKRRRYL